VARFEDPAAKEWQKPNEIMAVWDRSPARRSAILVRGAGYFSFPIAQKTGKSHRDRY
jgi:hypothetical protein